MRAVDSIKHLNIKAIIFDLDGILIDTEKMKFHAWLHAVKSYNKKIDPEFFKKNAIGFSQAEIAKRLKIKYSLPILVYELQKQYVRFERKLYENPKNFKLFKDAIVFLKDLPTSIKLGLATSSEKSVINLVLSFFKFKKYFSVILTANDVNKQKPHPEVYLKLSKKLNVKPKQCLVIEDTYAGVQAANKAGMFVIARPNEFTKFQNFSDADIIIKSLKEIDPSIFRE